jgi:hypothetical protein
MAGARGFPSDDETVGAAPQNVRRGAKTVMSKLERAARRQPAESLIAAAALGFFAGRRLRSLLRKGVKDYG